MTGFGESNCGDWGGSWGDGIASLSDGVLGVTG